MTFPLKITMSSEWASELQECERGLWEDRQSGSDSGKLKHLVFDIIERSWKSGKKRQTFELRSVEEAEDFYWALCTGTFQVCNEVDWDGDKYEERRFKVACRVADKIRPHLKTPEVRKLYPDGA